MFWLGLLVGGVVGAAAAWLGKSRSRQTTEPRALLKPAGGIITPEFTISPGNLTYICGSPPVIQGEIKGSAPYPLFLYGHAWAESVIFTPNPTIPHVNAVRISWPGTGGGVFTITDTTGAWPVSGKGGFCIWALHASQHLQGTFNCAGSNAGGIFMATGQKPIAQAVHDKGAAIYSVRVSDFEGTLLQRFNNAWAVQHRAASSDSLIWSNDGDAASTPRVVLSIDSLTGADVICTLKLGEVRLEYKLQGSRWKPLAQNLLSFLGGSGLNSESSVPQHIIVSPA